MKATPQFRSSSLTKSSFLLLALGTASLSALAPACSAPDGKGGSGKTNGTPQDSEIDLNPDQNSEIDPNGSAIVLAECQSGCTDFPADPIFDEESLAPVTEADVALFGADPNQFVDGSLCVAEPSLGSGDSPGALFPANWLRPRFRWTGAVGDTVYEIRLQAEEQANDFVAYTKNTSFKIPEDVWKRMAINTRKPITVTIRGAGGGAISGTRGTFQIAPVEAGGSMVFWATNTKQVSKDGSYLLSFTVGSENVIPALDLNQLIQQTELNGSSEERGITWSDGQNLRAETADNFKPGHQPGEIQCIGCHVSTPDGSSVIFGDDWPWAKVAANVDPDAGEIGASPSWLTPAGEAMLRMPFQGTPTMTESQWSDGNRLMVTSLAQLDGGKLFTKSGINDQVGTWNNGGNLVWMNLASTADINPYRGTDPFTNVSTREAALLAEQGNSWGVIALTGETYDSPLTPDWSHDGTRIAYTATNAADNGHPSKTTASVPSDIHIVPFNNGAGGQVVALTGANDETAKEYYPAFSQDDQWVAFNRAASGVPYYNNGSEIYVVNSAGGAPIRLKANDPAACTGEASPGITNSWAKWSPNVVSHEGKTYYFLVFSSARGHEGQFEMLDPWSPSSPPQKSAQLYMAAMVVDDATGQVTDYPAVYLWNQNRVVIGDVLTPTPSSNLTPAWDNFKIPAPPVVVR